MLFDLKNILWPYWRRATCQLVVCPHHHPTGSPQPVVQEWTADRTCLADILCKDCNTRAKTGSGSTQSAAGSITFGPFPGLLPPHWCTSGTETSSSVRGLDTANISIVQCRVVLDSYLTCLCVSAPSHPQHWYWVISSGCPKLLDKVRVQTLCIHRANCCHHAPLATPG